MSYAWLPRLERVLMDYQNNEIEQLRKKALSSLIITIILGIIFVFGMFSFIPVIWVVLFVLLGGDLFVFLKMINNYKTKVKDTIVSDMLKKEFDNISYNAKEGFSREYIANTELVSMGNIYSSNDLIDGNYRNVAFKQADVHIQQHTQSGKTSTTVTLFKGRWLIYTFNKRFTGFLQIRSNENRLFGNSKPLRWFSDRQNTSRIKLESETFNERFNIYASDENEAYYILTPHFMEKLIRLDDSLEGNLVVGFIDNEVHIALYNNKDAFEPSIFRPIDDEYYQEVQDDIELIKMIVDDLALDIDLYK